MRYSIHSRLISLFCLGSHNTFNVRKFKVALNVPEKKNFLSDEEEKLHLIIKSSWTRTMIIVSSK